MYLLSSICKSLLKNSINLSLEKVQNLINCAIYYFEENSSVFQRMENI